MDRIGSSTNRSVVDPFQRVSSRLDRPSSWPGPLGRRLLEKPRSDKMELIILLLWGDKGLDGYGALSCESRETLAGHLAL